MGILIAIVVVAVVVLAVAFWFIQQSRGRTELKGRFGSEYNRTIDTAESRREGEKELVEREKRVQRLQLKELEPGQAERFAEQWRSAQGRFVDQPAEAIREADNLVQQVMTARGDPTTDFEQQAADISVDHPEVITNYRAAHAVAEANAIAPASTEDLRQAMVHYRALFNDLLGAATPAGQRGPA